MDIPLPEAFVHSSRYSYLSCGRSQLVRNHTSAGDPVRGLQLRQRAFDDRPLLRAGILEAVG